MLPGAPKHTEIKQLGEAHTLLAHKEDCFIREVIRIGEILPLRLQTFFLRSIQKQQHCVPIKVVADYLLEFHPAKLLPGFSTGNIKAVEKNLSDFWPAYRQYNANHPVFNDHQNKLHRCLPCKLHSDEGTGLRKSAVMQYSWGGVLTDAPNSFDRYFFWCSLLGEEYKKAHAGYEAGNVVLDEVCEELARQCQETYLNGVQSAKLDCVFFLGWGLRATCQPRRGPFVSSATLAVVQTRCALGVKLTISLCHSVTILKQHNGRRLSTRPVPGVRDPLCRRLQEQRQSCF